MEALEEPEDHQSYYGSSWRKRERLDQISWPIIWYLLRYLSLLDAFLFAIQRQNNKTESRKS